MKKSVLIYFIHIFLLLSVLFWHVETAESPQHFRDAVNSLPFFQFKSDLKKSFHTQDARFCFCGVDLPLMDGNDDYFTKRDIMTLVDGDFDINRFAATEDMNQFFSKPLGAKLSLGLAWFSPVDPSFWTFEMQKFQLHSVLEGWANIITTAGGSMTVNGCDKVFEFYNVEVSARMFENKKLYNTVIPAYGQDEVKFFEFVGFKKSVPALMYAFPKPLKISFAKDKTINSKVTMKHKTNIAYCDFSIEVPIENGIGDPSNQLTNITVYYGERDFGGTNKIRQLGFINEKYDFTGDSLEKFKEYFIEGSKAAGKKHGIDSLAVYDFTGFRIFSSKARFFTRQMEKLINEGNDITPEWVKEHALLPNAVEFNMCTFFMKEDSVANVAKYFGFNIQDKKKNISNFGRKIWITHANKCPMIAMRGLLYSNKSGVYKPLYGDFPIKYFAPVEVDYEGTKYKIPPALDPKDVMDPDYSKALEELEKVHDEQIKEMEEAIKNTQIELPDPQKLKEELDEVELVPADDNDPDKSTKTPKDEVVDEIIPVETPEVVVTHTVKYVLLKKEQESQCKTNFNYLTNYLKGTIGKKADDILEVIHKILWGPDDEGLCDDLIYYSWQSPCVVDEQSRLNVFCVNVRVEEEGESPIFHLHFYNHDWDNTQDDLIYLPYAEIPNQQPKFVEIFESYKTFFKNNNSGKLTPLKINQLVHKYLANFLTNSPWNILHIGAGDQSDVHREHYLKFHQNNITNEASKKNKYVLDFFGLLNEKNQLYEFALQAWVVGKYIGLEILGTQFSYFTMISSTAGSDTLDLIFNSLYESMRETYVDDGTRIPTLQEIKRYIIEVCFLKDDHLAYQSGITDPSINPSEEFSKEDEMAIKSNSRNNVMMLSGFYTAYDTAANMTVVVQLKESIPVVNFRFDTFYFQAEYMIPITSITTFQQNFQATYLECFHHLQNMFLFVKQAENDPSKVGDGGKYTFAELKVSLLANLKDYEVYGCLQDDKSAGNGDMDYEEDKPVFQISQRIVILKSNKPLNLESLNVCEPTEEFNPPLIELYSTDYNRGEEDGIGYTLKFDVIDPEGKRITNSYNFPKKQDYDHKKILEINLMENLPKYFNKKIEGGAENLRERRNVVVV